MIKFLISLFVLLTFTQTTSADWTTARFNSNNTAAPPYSLSEPIETLWTSQNIGSIISTPVVDGEGNIYLNVYNKGLVALDKNGSQKWALATTIQGSPVIDNEGNVYFSGGVCYSIIFSINKNGQERWHYDVKPQGAACSSFSAIPPALSRDQKTVYTSAGYPSKTMVALNMDGTLKWQAGLNGYDPASITVGTDETIYVGTGGSGYLFAMDTGGAIKWQAFTAGGYTVSAQTPILDAVGNIYTVASGAVPPAIVSFDPLGRRRWIVRGSEATGFTSLPALKDQKLYVTEGANIRAVDATNGTTVWQWSPPFPTTRNLSPLTVDKDGNIYGTLGDKLFVIDPNGQTKNTITWGNYLGWIIIPQNDLILVIKNNISNGWMMALGKKQITKTPLILIPGIGGSELKVNEMTIWNKDNGHGGTFNHAYGQDETVWVNEGEAANPGHDDYFDVLRMKTNGLTSEANIGIGGSLVMRAYGEAINFFNSNGYQLNKDFFVFPYDWRKDISATKAELDNKINQIKTQTGAEKVDIVAHSMGGLVARNYIADPTKAGNVRKLFTLGTPHLGAPKFVKTLRFGDCIIYDVGPFCLSIAPSEIKDVIQNLVSGFQLAPSQTYFNFYSDEDNLHPYPYRTENGSLNYLQIKNLLSILGHTTSLFGPAEIFHSLDNSLSNTNGVDVTIIAGSGRNTLGQIVEKIITDLNGNKIVYKDKFDINGDKTVPLLSAAITDPHKGLFLNGPAKVYYTNQEHKDLVTQGAALNLVKNILDGDSSLPNGTSNQPYKLIGHGLSVHSPVNIHVYDPNNNHTGPLPNGDFEVNIPGSSYDTLDDAKFIFLPEDGQYTINFEATDQGSFDFKIRKYEDDVNTESVLYKNIPITASSTGQADLDTNFIDPPVLQIDQQPFKPTATILGNENFDHTPPLVSIDANPKTLWPPNSKMIDVKITGESSDINLYRTIFIVEDEYGLAEPTITNFGQTIQLQSSRKGDDKDGRKYVIKAIAEDLAGNISEAKVEVIVPHDQGKKK